MLSSRNEPGWLEVRLFGTPSVHSAQGRIRMSPRQLALVVLVYGHAPKGLSRPRATHLLWGADPTSGARHRLRQLLVEIRVRVGSRIIDTDADLLRPRSDLPSDLAGFEQGLSNGSLLDAALILRGGFAVLVAGSVSDDFDDWRSAAAAKHLRRLRARALQRWEHANGSGDWLTAKDAAEALYALDPHDPEGVHRMIDVLARLGQPESAERVFAQYRGGLPSGSQPALALRTTIQRVRRLKDANSSLLGSTEDEVPLMGRRDALARARTVFDRVDAGLFGFVLIAGESGIGKTRMLRELRRECVLRDLRCLEAQAVELECRIPLNPILDALRSVDLRPHLSALGQPWDAVIGGVLPVGTLVEPVVAPPTISDLALPRRLLDAFSLLFERLALERPTVLFIDDLHWADATTIAVLQFMQRRWSRGPFGIVATIRPELVVPSDDVAKYLSSPPHPFGINRVDLLKFDLEDALRLVDHIGKGEIGRELAQRICSLAGLHPLYLTELARDYLAGRLRLPELPVHEVTIPVSLKQILDSRLTYLSDAALRVAGLLAVAARPMRLGDAARMLSLSLDSVMDAVDELRRARLIEYERHHVRIAHDLFRSTIYSHMSEPRRAINHRAVAEQIEADEGSEAAAELATHYARAGEAAMAARYGALAAARAMESGAVADAAHFFQLVIENDEDLTRRADATAAQARALYLARDIDRAVPLLELAASRLASVGRRADALRFEVRRVEGLAEMGSVSLADLLQRLARIKAQARSEDDWEGVALALDAELHLLHRRGDLVGIGRNFVEMRDVARRGSLEATLLCCAGLALGVLFGDPDEALQAARRAVALATGGRGYRLRALLRLILVLQYRGMLELPGSRPLVREARELAQRSGDVLVHFSIESNLAVAALDAGDLETAEAQMDCASALAGSADMDLNRFIQANNKAELSIARYDFRRAHDAYLEAASYAGKATPAYLMDLVHAGIGLCALEMGNLAEARSREHQLGPTPATWYFDPTTILAFRSRLLCQRQDQTGALLLLETAAASLENRLVLAWLKVRALHVRLLKKTGSPQAQGLALDCMRRAERLHLGHRAREFGDHLDDDWRGASLGCH